MKVLFDENMPPALRQGVAAHVVMTVRAMGWAGSKNGRLLALAQEHGFDALVTRDQSLPYQNDIPGCGLRVVILHGPARLLPGLMARVATALAELQPGQVRRIG